MTTRHIFLTESLGDKQKSNRYSAVAELSIFEPIMKIRRSSQMNFPSNAESLYCDEQLNSLEKNLGEYSGRILPRRDAK